MYFWRIEELKAGLRQGPLAQSESVKYLVPWLIAMFAAAAPGMPVRGKSTFDVVFYVLTGLIWVWGFRGAYYANGGSAGMDFIPRYLALTWVHALRFICKLVIPLVLFGAFVFRPLAIELARAFPDTTMKLLKDVENAQVIGGSVGLGIGIILGIAFFLRLHAHFRSVVSGLANNALERTREG